MVQAKGKRPLDSRLSAERDSSAKYSTSARSRTCGLAAAMRAMPTSRWGPLCPRPAASAIARLAGARVMPYYSLFVRLLVKPLFVVATARFLCRGPLRDRREEPTAQTACRGYPRGVE